MGYGGSRSTVPRKLPRLSELAHRAYAATTQTFLDSFEPPMTPTNIPSTSRNEAVSPRTPTQQPSTSRSGAVSPKIFTSPFEFRGLPKAGPRKRGLTERRKVKSIIATDTPNKKEIKQRAEEKNEQKTRKKSEKSAAKRKVLVNNSEDYEIILKTMSLYSKEEPNLEELITW